MAGVFYIFMYDSAVRLELFDFFAMPEPVMNLCSLLFLLLASALLSSGTELGSGAL